MKILHLIESSGLYGAESVILNLSREMKTVGMYEPVIGCIVSSPDEKNDLYDKALSYNIESLKIVIRNSCLFVDLPAFVLRCREMDIHIIHSHGYKPSVYGFFVKLFTGIHVTSTCHLWFMGANRPLKQRIMTALELFCYRFFPVVIGVSEPIRKILIDHKVSGDKIVVIKNGIFLGDYNGIKSDKHNCLRTEFDIKEGLPIVLNVARLNEQKDQSSIISAAKQLIDKGFHYKFFIVGEGHLRHSLELEISEKGLQKDVFLLGYRDDIPMLLRNSDVFILPSIDEGMPMALLEAIASKIPVVATQVGDIPKLIAHEKTGFIVNIKDVNSLSEGISCVLEHPEQSSEMAENAYEELQEKYSSSSMYRQYDVVYNKYFLKDDIPKGFH